MMLELNKYGENAMHLTIRNGVSDELSNVRV